MGRLLIRCNEQQHINLIQDTLQEIYSLNQNVCFHIFIYNISSLIIINSSFSHLFLLDYSYLMD